MSVSDAMVKNCRVSFITRFPTFYALLEAGAVLSEYQMTEKHSYEVKFTQDAECRGHPIPLKPTLGDAR